VNGEELDLDSAIGAIVDKHSGRTPSEKVYQMRKKAEREVSTLFLLDLSASTDEWVDKEAYREALQRFDWEDYHNRRMTNLRDPKTYTPGSEKIFEGKKIIDVEKEALVVMAEALEPIGDDYGIYGFSGYGRDNVEFFMIRDFDENYSELCKGRIGGIKPFRSTRMGPAIRHAVYKLSKRDARLKVMIILSDGYPQDYDYGKDRTNKEYGINDTKIAMREARDKGIHTFCITVDKEGYSYLEEMCGRGNFLVIEDIASLPQKLPKIYRGLTT
ncbi:MAG: VWA domain-containing protein, partial [Candidatus Tectomicrobia bacterium]|nr:VWA domain-containing protein [Candidatus Tectomicrobia bacterium]